MASTELYYAEIRIINPVLRGLFEESKIQEIFPRIFLNVILAPKFEGRSDHVIHLVNQRVRTFFEGRSTKKETLPALVKVRERARMSSF